MELLSAVDGLSSLNFAAADSFIILLETVTELNLLRAFCLPFFDEVTELESFCLPFEAETY